MLSASHLLSPAHCRPLRAQHIARHALLVSTTVTTSFVVAVDAFLVEEWPLLCGMVVLIALPLVPLVVERLVRRVQVRACATSSSTSAAALVDDVVAAPWTPSIPQLTELLWRQLSAAVVTWSVCLGLGSALGAASQLPPAFVFLSSSTLFTLAFGAVSWATAFVSLAGVRTSPLVALGAVLVFPVVVKGWGDTVMPGLAMALGHRHCGYALAPLARGFEPSAVAAVCLTLTLAIAVTCHNRWQRRQSTG